MGNSSCEFLLNLSAVLIQQLLEFLVFKLFWLAEMFLIRKIKISTPKPLIPLFARFMGYSTFTQSRTNNFLNFSSVLFLIKMGKECSVSNTSFRHRVHYFILWSYIVCSPRHIMFWKHRDSFANRNRAGQYLILKWSYKTPNVNAPN